MKGKDLVHKDITIQSKDKEWLDLKAQELGMTTNQLIRIIIKDYMKKEN